MAKKNVSKRTGAYVLLSLVVLLAAGVWFFGLGGSAQIEQRISAAVFPTLPSTPINEYHRFITYRSPLGFSLAYPVGFVAEEPFLGVTAFRAYATVPGGLPEVIEVLVDNSTTSQAEFASSIEPAQEAGATTTRVFTNTAGQEARLIITDSILPVAPEISGEKATVFQAFYDCVAVESGPYVSLLIVTIPQSLPQDLAVAEFTVNSFRC